MKKAAAQDVNVIFADEQKINKSAQNTSCNHRSEERNKYKKETTPEFRRGLEGHHAC